MVQDRLFTSVMRIPECWSPAWILLFDYRKTPEGREREEWNEKHEAHGHHRIDNYPESWVSICCWNWEIVFRSRLNSEHWQENKVNDEVEGVAIKPSEFLERCKEVPTTVQPSSWVSKMLLGIVPQSSWGLLPRSTGLAFWESSEAQSDSQWSCHS